MACQINGDEYKCNMGANTCFDKKIYEWPVARATMVLFAQSLKLSRQAAVVEAAVVVPFALPGAQSGGKCKQVCNHAR